MDSNFWLERWAKHEIGFHQQRINDYLPEFWPQLQVQDDATVFVPLCGKSLDMRWLRERGHPVIGVEIARLACEEFFAEWKVVPEVTRADKFERWSANGVTVLCGDFFELQREDLVQVRATFDRAALIALPPQLRIRYVDHLRAILPSPEPLLLVAPEYDQATMKGPPFSVSETEVRTLFQGATVSKLASVDVTDAPEHARFRERGLTQLIEQVFRIDF